MAPPARWPAPNGCLRDHSASHAPGTATTPHKPARKGPSSLPMIGRRSPASSSFVLAAARLRALQLDPSRAATEPGSCEEDPEEQSGQPGDTTKSPGQIRHALLTPMALMGAASRSVAVVTGGAGLAAEAWAGNRDGGVV